MTLHDSNLHTRSSVFLPTLAEARRGSQPGTRQFRQRHPATEGLDFDAIDTILRKRGLALAPQTRACHETLHRASSYIFFCVAHPDHYPGLMTLKAMLKSSGCKDCETLERKRRKWRKLTG